MERARAPNILIIENMTVLEVWEKPYEAPDRHHWENDVMVWARLDGYDHFVKLNHYNPNELDLDINSLVGLTAGEASRVIVKTVQNVHKILSLITPED